MGAGCSSRASCSFCNLLDDLRLSELLFVSTSWGLVECDVFQLGFLLKYRKENRAIECILIRLSSLF
jgi:hypothetical protein